MPRFFVAVKKYENFLAFKIKRIKPTPVFIFGYHFAQV